MKIRVEWSELLIEKGKLDPVGLWRVGDRLISELLPPFTTVVQQRPARYFSMYCWILHEAGKGLTDKAKATEFWGRFYTLEGVFLCALQLHSPHEYTSFGGRIGSEHAQALLHGVEDDDIIDFSVLKLAGIRNGWEVNYKGPMEAFGLTEVDFGMPGNLGLTKSGKLLADAYETSIQNTSFLKTHRGATRIPKNIVQGLGQAGCPCLLHDAGSPALVKERRTVKRLLIREPPSVQSDGTNTLWESLHLILDVLASVSPHGIDRGTSRWRQLLTNGLLPDGRRYQPSPSCLETFRKWRLYAVDSLFTYALESALDGFLEELHGHDQMTPSDVRRTFSRALIPEADKSFIGMIADIRALSDKQQLAVERDAIATIQNAKAKQKTAAAFHLFCFCQAKHEEFMADNAYAAATTFYAQRASWDGQEFTLLQSTAAVSQSKTSLYTVFIDQFLMEWVIGRQLAIRAQRNKELAWFSYNSETRTYDWEDVYHPTLYRADRFENLMGFLANLNVVTIESGEWRNVPGSLDEVKA